jgi:hypothetical protein
MPVKKAIPRKSATISSKKTVTPRKLIAAKSQSAKTPMSGSTPVAKAKAVKAKAIIVIAKKSKKPTKADSKTKVVRDSFTMPQSDYAKIAELKVLCLKSGMKVKKSELLRAGLHALGKLSASQLKQALSGLEAIKTGRPMKH